MTDLLMKESCISRVILTDGKLLATDVHHLIKKKYVVAYLNQDKEIVICDFVSSKLLA